MASKEARALNHSYVGTEHILLGLLREGEGVAAHVLKSLDIDIERTRNEILKELDPNFTPGEEENSDGESFQEAPAGNSATNEKKQGGGKTPALKAFGRDLTELAQKSEMVKSCDWTGGGNRTGHPNPLPPHEKQSGAYWRSRCGQDRHRGGFGSGDRQWERA